MKIQDKKVDVLKVLEDEIVSLSDGIKRLRSGRLNDRAIVSLIWEASSVSNGYQTRKVGKTEIKEILDAVENLPAFFFKKKNALESQ